MKHVTKKKPCNMVLLPGRSSHRSDLYQVSFERKYTFSEIDEKCLKDDIQKEDWIRIVQSYTDTCNVVPSDILFLTPQKEDNNDGSKSASLYKCPLCQTVYSTKQNLLKHARNTSICQNRQDLNRLYQRAEEKAQQA